MVFWMSDFVAARPISSPNQKYTGELASYCSVVALYRAFEINRAKVKNARTNNSKALYSMEGQ